MLLFRATTRVYLRLWDYLFLHPQIVARGAAGGEPRGQVAILPSHSSTVPRAFKAQPLDHTRRVGDVYRLQTLHKNMCLGERAKAFDTEGHPMGSSIPPRAMGM